MFSIIMIQRERIQSMKLGIIGYGFIIREFLPGLVTLPGIEIQAILGKPGREEAVETLCKQFQIPQGVYNFPDLLATGIDTVYVAVPNHLHFSYGKMALEAGLNVILEKPMTSNQREAEILQTMAMERGLFLFEAITTLYLPGYETIRQWLPQIGQVRMVQSHYVKYSSRYDAFRKGQTPPAFDPAQSGGALMDLNVYNIHFVTGLFGLPESVQYTANIERGVDLNGMLVMQYPGFTALCTAGKDCSQLRSCAILGTQGAIYTDDASSIIGNVTLELRNGIRESFPDPDGKLRHLQEFSSFRDAIHSGDTAFCYRQLSHSIRVMHLLDQARISAGIHFPADEI